MFKVLVFTQYNGDVTDKKKFTHNMNIELYQNFKSYPLLKFEIEFFSSKR